MVKIERTPIPPASLAVEKQKACGSYTKPDVTEQLSQDFHNKCYLCEISPPHGIEVEHLRPHGGNIDRKFDWTNLFLACSHCNSLKNQAKYHDMILDCCKVEPENILDYQLAYGHVCVCPLAQVPEKEAVLTADLLTACFEHTNTGIREQECKIRIDELSKTMDSLYKQLHEYQSTASKKSLRALRGMLSRTYKFVGFTRAYVRTHLETYPDLAEYVQLQ